MAGHDLRRLGRALVDAVIRSGRVPVEVDVDEDERLTGYEDLAGRAVIDARFEMPTHSWTVSPRWSPTRV